MAQKIRADELKRAIGVRHKDDIFITECKTGATWTNDALLKFDALAIKKSWSSPCFTGYEVKVDRQDFMSDDKWPGYKQFCHRFSFVCPTGLIQPDELPDDVGLIWYNPEKGTLFTKKKAAFREIKPSAEMLYYILMSRTDSEKHPFFSNQREHLEAYLQDKVDRNTFGRAVQSKMLNDVIDLREQLESAERIAQRVQSKADKFDYFDELVYKLTGSYLSWDNDGERLAAALREGLSEQAKQKLRRLVESAKDIEKLIG